MDIFSLTRDELTKEFQNNYGKGDFHATIVYRHVMKNGSLNFSNVDEFRKSSGLLEKILDDLIVPVTEVSRIIKERETIKFILKLSDGLESESVIIPMLNHNTLCISSQVGCKLQCRFCETGAMGFKRNLTVSEIVGQVYVARFVLKKNIKNLVFMGMGEPLDNFSNLKKAINILTDQRGLDFAQSHITISTAGLPEMIKKLGELNMGRLNLAVSLNAPNDKIRSWLMPVNNKYSMKDLKKDLLNYPLRKKGYFFIEYVLIKGINDSYDHAKQVAAYLAPMNIRLNLIPLNKTSCFDYPSTRDSDIHRFAGYLEAHKVFVRKRWSKGSSLAAGCGQLGRHEIK